MGAWMMSDDMKISKGLEFPVVALSGVGQMPAKGEGRRAKGEGRRRARGCAGVCCGGDAGHAEIGDWGG